MTQHDDELEDEGLDEDGLDDEPLPQIAGLRNDPSQGFLLRVRRSIGRRVLAGDLASMGWFGIPAAMMEYFSALMESLEPPADKQEED